LRDVCTTGEAWVDAGEQLVSTKAVRLQLHSAPSKPLSTGWGRDRNRPAARIASVANVIAIDLEDCRKSGIAVAPFV